MKIHERYTVEVGADYRRWSVAVGELSLMGTCLSEGSSCHSLTTARLDITWNSTNVDLLFVETDSDEKKTTINKTILRNTRPKIPRQKCVSNKIL